MKEQPPGVSLRQYLARRLLPSTLAIGILFSLSLPLTYYFLEAGRMKQTATIYAKEIADGVATIVGESPILWKYQVQKYLKMIYEYTPYKDIDQLHVRDETGQLISEYTLHNHSAAAKRPWRATSGRAVVVFNNRPIGTVEVFMPLATVFRKAFLIFIFSLISGSGLAYFTFAFPIRVVSDADETIRTAREELERKVEERTRELAAANEALKLENVERKRAEEQLIEAQEELVRKEKLALLGQLSGSVGHELRNPLGVMSNAVYYLKMVLSDADETTREYLEIIRHEIDISLRIITDLLDFARTQTPQSKTVAARELVLESLGRCAIPENVAVATDLPETLPKVLADPLQMGQVLQNLITNAVQAMPNGGALRISARRVPGPETGNTSDPRPPVPAPGFIEISVIDNGDGLSPGDMKNIFQPLFTTKPRGIGLGLVVCKKLTEANGGRIQVESQLGKGTTFMVTLPFGAG